MIVIQKSSYLPEVHDFEHSGFVEINENVIVLNQGDYERLYIMLCHPMLDNCMQMVPSKCFPIGTETRKTEWVESNTNIRKREETILWPNSRATVEFLIHHDILVNRA